jgi:hypothetical protein
MYFGQSTKTNCDLRKTTFHETRVKLWSEIKKIEQKKQDVEGCRSELLPAGQFDGLPGNLAGQNNPPIVAVSRGA